jgi:hypothetical protein
VRLWRIACSFGAAHHAMQKRGMFDAEAFRAKLHSRNPAISELVRCVLAACGGIDWPNASRRVRACFVVNRLVTYFRDAAP